MYNLLRVYPLRRQWLSQAAVLLATVMLGIALGVEASGTVTFFVKIEPGLKISSPDTLTSPVALGQTDVQDLNITVGPVRWQLLVEAIGYGGEDGLHGMLEIRGQEVGVSVPMALSFSSDALQPVLMVFCTNSFRFTPSFLPMDDYSFQVKLTVPAL